MSMPIPTRRLKWNPAPPHSPNIIHLPRRPPRENCKPTAEKPHSSATLPPQDEDRAGVVPIVVLNSTSCAHERERAEEKRMVQAEMWRAGRNILRMEREFAPKKLQRNRVQMEATLRSAVQSLIAGKKKMCEGKKSNEDGNVEKEIGELAEKVEELRRSSKRNGDSEIKGCSKKQGGELGGREKEEFGSTSNSSTANSSAASPPNRIAEFSNTQNPHQEEEEALIVRAVEENKCSGRCKAVVRKIIEHVKAESDQWSQMHEMVGRVRDEMQLLQSSRDFWEHRSRQSSSRILSLHSTVEEWKEKAQRSEAKANELQKQLSAALEKLRATNQEGPVENKEAIKSTQSSPRVSLCKHMEREKRVPISPANKSHGIQDDDVTAERAPQISLAMQIEKEKRVLLSRLKENVLEISPRRRRRRRRRRSPLREVANSQRSPLGKGGQNEQQLG